MPVTLAREAVFTVIDFETTGSVPGWPVEPWQIGMVRMRNGKVVPEEAFDAYLRIAPDRPFNPRAPGRHAALRDTLAASPTAQELWPELLPWFRVNAVVAHNIGTERSQLAAIAPMHRIGPWIDTLTLVRKSFPQLASKALGDVLQAFGLVSRVDALCPGRAVHDALYDAIGCAVLLEYFLAFPGWERLAVENLVTNR